FRNILNGNVFRLRNAVAKAVKFRKISNDIAGLRRDNDNAPYHVFGNHNKCDSYYCKGPKENKINKELEMEKNGIFGEIITTMRRYLLVQSKSLIQDLNSNIVESYNAIVAKCISGKLTPYAFIKEKVRKLYWLVGPFSELTIENKHLLYIAIIKPIWIYGIQLCGCASKSNIGVIQRCQNIALRTITAAYRFERNNAIHRDMMLLTIADEIQRFARKHETRLDRNVNPLAIQLLDNSKDFRPLKRFKQCDLVSDFRLRQEPLHWK
ncbi:Uncharacterized protein FWK35_00018468, partial [Aphis craccivora]